MICPESGSLSMDSHHMLNQKILNFPMWNWRCKVAFEQDLSIGDVFNGKTYPDVPFSPKSTPQSMKFYNPVCQTPKHGDTRAKSGNIELLYANVRL